jgi:hypothetical protein
MTIGMGSLWADSLVLVNSQSGQGANDTISWATLGGDQKILPATFAVKSAGGASDTVTLAGANSVVSIVCSTSPSNCSWTGGTSGTNRFTAGNSLIWTSDAGNGGNGPLKLAFAAPLSGAGALIQANIPGQFTAKIEAFNGATSLGSFTVPSDASGDPVYIGLKDQTGANISSVVFSLTACAATCTDFGIDTPNLNVGVTQSPTTTTVASSLNPSTFGAAVTFTATVTSSGGTPTGTVTFKDGATTLGTGTLSSGKATFKTSTLTVASHSITAVYGGSSSFKTSTSPALTQTVKQAASSTAVASSLNPSTFGAAVTFTATVTSSGGTPTGTVTFKNGTAALGTGTLSSGKATFKTSTLTVGSHSITAVYGGSTNFITSTSPALTQTVKQATSSTAVSSSLNPSTFGAAVTFTATVTSSGGTPTGTVTFKNGTATLGTGTLSSGKATFKTSTLTLGSHSITAVYGGSTNFITSTSPALTQTVKQATSSTAVASSLNPSTFGAAVTFTATVTSSGGVPTGTVTFKNGTATLGTGTLSSGKATFKTSTLTLGGHSITAVYGGSTNFITSTSPALTQTVKQATSSTKVASSLNPSTFGTAVTFTATVTSSGGTPTGTVTFKNGTATLGTGTLSGGKATFKTSTLAKGSHSITAAYGGSTNFVASTSPALSQTVN